MLYYKHLFYILVNFSFLAILCGCVGLNDSDNDLESPYYLNINGEKYEPDLNFDVSGPGECFYGAYDFDSEEGFCLDLQGTKVGDNHQHFIMNLEEPTIHQLDALHSGYVLNHLKVTMGEKFRYSPDLNYAYSDPQGSATITEIDRGKSTVVVKFNQFKIIRWKKKDKYLNECGGTSHEWDNSYYSTKDVTYTINGIWKFFDSNKYF
jgi:hypothetical protein